MGREKEKKVKEKEGGRGGLRRRVDKVEEEKKIKDGKFIKVYFGGRRPK